MISSKLLLKNVLIDKQVNYLERNEFQGLFKEYDKKFVVGKDMKATSFNEIYTSEKLETHFN